MVPEINELIKKIRGKDSLRKANEKTGISYTYWSILERGIDPRTKSPIKPSPDTLRAISTGYKFPYEELMKTAGYLEENEKENAEAISKSRLDLAVEQIEKDLDVSIKDDPEIMEALESYLRTLGKMKKK